MVLSVSSRKNSSFIKSAWLGCGAVGGERQVVGRGYTDSVFPPCPQTCILNDVLPTSSYHIPPAPLVLDCHTSSRCCSTPTLPYIIRYNTGEQIKEREAGPVSSMCRQNDSFLGIRLMPLPLWRYWGMGSNTLWDKDVFQFNQLGQLWQRILLTFVQCYK